MFFHVAGHMILSTEAVFISNFFFFFFFRYSDEFLVGKKSHFLREKQWYTAVKAYG